jgi:hypothetical protein|nr:MAG TPA: Rubrerythrin, rubrerythrin, peroxidase, peroxide, oxidized [Caudoviricetes sp.]
MENSNCVQDFNEEPVFYCSHCLSLSVRRVEDSDFCDKCGCTEIESSSIEDWESKYTEKYGHKYIE